MKVAKQPVFCRDFLDDQTKGHHVVRHRERVGIAQIDLVLRRRAFVVARLDADVHFFERERRFAAQRRGDIVAREIEVAALIERLRHERRAFDGRFEVEKLDFRANIKGVAQSRRVAQLALQNPARIGVGGRAIRQTDVAKQARDGAFRRAEGQQAKRGGIGKSDHVAFVFARKTFDGAAVEGDAFFESTLEFVGDDGHAFERAEDVGEPEAHELDLALLSGAQHEFDVLVVVLGGLAGALTHGGVLRDRVLKDRVLRELSGVEIRSERVGFGRHGAYQTNNGGPVAPNLGTRPAVEEVVSREFSVVRAVAGLSIGETQLDFHFPARSRAKCLRSRSTGFPL